MISYFVVKRLSKKNLSVATAESCTGGMIASSLVAINGASDCFMEGFVTYSNNAKSKYLNVSKETLKKYGAVSKETASEMAIGVKKAAKADFGIATTGIAGPTGGSEEKPVGLVYISCATNDYVLTRKYIFKGNRNQVRLQAKNKALELLWECSR